MEPACAVLEIAPSTYYAAKKREETPPARDARDEKLKREIMRVWKEKGRGVDGARKVWHELKREGIEVARCTVERLMGELGIAGASARRRRPRTTVPAGPGHERPSDLLERDFTAPAPKRRWVADITERRETPRIPLPGQCRGKGSGALLGALAWPRTPSSLPVWLAPAPWRATGRTLFGLLAEVFPVAGDRLGHRPQEAGDRGDLVGGEVIHDRADAQAQGSEEVLGEGEAGRVVMQAYPAPVGVAADPPQVAAAFQAVDEGSRRSRAQTDGRAKFPGGERLTALLGVEYREQRPQVGVVHAVTLGEGLGQVIALDAEIAQQVDDLAAGGWGIARQRGAPSLPWASVPRGPQTCCYNLSIVEILFCREKW